MFETRKQTKLYQPAISTTTTPRQQNIDATHVNGEDVPCLRVAAGFILIVSSWGVAIRVIINKQIGCTNTHAQFEIGPKRSFRTASSITTAPHRNEPAQVNPNWPAFLELFMLFSGVLAVQVLLGNWRRERSAEMLCAGPRVATNEHAPNRDHIAPLNSPMVSVLSAIGTLQREWKRRETQYSGIFNSFLFATGSCLHWRWRFKLLFQHPSVDWCISYLQVGD